MQHTCNIQHAQFWAGFVWSFYFFPQGTAQQFVITTISRIQDLFPDLDSQLTLVIDHPPCWTHWMDQIRWITWKWMCSMKMFSENIPKLVTFFDLKQKPFMKLWFFQASNGDEISTGPSCGRESHRNTLWRRSVWSEQWEPQVFRQATKHWNTTTKQPIQGVYIYIIHIHLYIYIYIFNHIHIYICVYNYIYIIQLCIYIV